MIDINPTPIKGAYILKYNLIGDSRGYFKRVFCEQELSSALNSKKIVQINISQTREAATIRGMHFQYAPNAEMKIVQCIEGRVFDVIVDLRPDSESFLKWVPVELSAESHSAIVIPEGCAHGFQSLEDDSKLLYFHTAAYSKGSEGGVSWNDPMIDIKWPLAPKNISDRDHSYPKITNNFKGINL